MGRFTNAGDKAIPISILAILIFIWEIIARFGIIPPYILPPPTKIVITLVTSFPIWKGHMVVTLIEALAGFIIAIAFAIIVSIVMDSIPVIRKATYPLIIASQTIPIIIIAPLFAIWFGFGYLPKIVIVILICFFPITISLVEGFSSVDKDLINLLKSMGADRVQLYKIVKLPASMPNFFSGLKISGTYSITGATIGEWVGGKKGLGVYMLRVKSSFATDKVFATIIIITLLSVMVLMIINFVEKRCMPWIYNDDNIKGEDE